MIYTVKDMTRKQELSKQQLQPVQTAIATASNLTRKQLMAFWLLDFHSKQHHNKFLVVLTAQST
jgi:hypothetical protein